MLKRTNTNSKGQRNHRRHPHRAHACMHTKAACLHEGSTCTQGQHVPLVLTSGLNRPQRTNHVLGCWVGPALSQSREASSACCAPTVAYGRHAPPTCSFCRISRSRCFCTAALSCTVRQNSGSCASQAVCACPHTEADAWAVPPFPCSHDRPVRPGACSTLLAQHELAGMHTCLFRGGWLEAPQQRARTALAAAKVKQRPVHARGGLGRGSGHAVLFQV